ncbi:MAG: transcriptional regulator [Candidatus Marinimicrobia bacterium]|nr:transcriptional regulator [Candidatus Neomarinimicrobiota bacterium]
MTDFDYQQIDDLIHSRIRLSIIALLASCEEASFVFIRKKTGATDGNLSVQLRKLEEASLITVKKEFIKRKPVSTYSITEKGRNAFQEYVKRIESLLQFGELS